MKGDQGRQQGTVRTYPFLNTWNPHPKSTTPSAPSAKPPTTGRASKFSQCHVSPVSRSKNRKAPRARSSSRDVSDGLRLSGLSVADYLEAAARQECGDDDGFEDDC